MRTPVERNPNVGAAGYPSDKFSAKSAVRARNSSYDNNQGGNSKNWGEKEQKFLVHMRGLPFKATEQDIVNVRDLHHIFNIVCRESAVVF